MCFTNKIFFSSLFGLADKRMETLWKRASPSKRWGEGGAVWPRRGVGVSRECVDFQFAAIPRVQFAAIPRVQFAAIPRAQFAAIPRVQFAAIPCAQFAAIPLGVRT